MTTDNEDLAPDDDFELTPEQEAELVRRIKEFEDCPHDWVPEPEDSFFHAKCSICGGAEGIRMPDGWLDDDEDDHDS